jgi:hypothetical protein
MNWVRNIEFRNSLEQARRDGWLSYDNVIYAIARLGLEYTGDFPSDAFPRSLSCGSQ